MKARLILFLVVVAGVLWWRPEWRNALFQYAGAALQSWTAARPAPPPVQDPPESGDSRAPGALVPAANDPGEESPSPDGANPAGPGENPPDAGEEEGPVEPTGNLPARLPQLRTAAGLPPELRSLKAEAEASKSAASYRRLADRAAAAGFPEAAAEAYEREAQVYTRLGDPNAAAVERLKAGRYRTEARLFVHSAAAPSDTAAEDPAAGPRARLEPPYGCLLGAFIDRDDQLSSTFMDENWQTHRDPGEFAERVGKPHASLFCYLQYGRPFPFKWAERLRDAGVIPHLAWEPRRLSEVTEESLSLFAASLARFDSPVFIRFAGEMNGEWTPYHGNPALYREKFRLVHRVLNQRAPKAALIWCVNSVPLSNIDSYYPGDDAVDWVGVNLYNVLYFDNDPKRPADRVHPADLLAPIYKKYAGRKPIALCEYAASQQASIDPAPRPEFAATRLSQLYAALPRVFPRVKLVDWFDCNNLKHARPDRQLNNYSLTEDPTVLRAYRQAIEPAYFMGSVEKPPAEIPRPLRAGETVRGVVTFSAWVRTHLDRPRVYLTAGDQVLHAGDEPGPYLCRWDTRRARPGTHAIRLLVLDREGRLIREERQAVQVEKP